jgi:hypothetical protein
LYGMSMMANEKKSAGRTASDRFNRGNAEREEVI